MAFTTAVAAVAAVAATASAVVQGVSNYQQSEVTRKQNKFNEYQEEQARKQAFQEESLNATQHYRAVRHEIASGLNTMVGMGNIGTSEESALRSGYFNLSEDLSALRYRYGAEAEAHRVAGLNYRYNAKVAKYNRDVGVLASSLNTASAASRGMLGIYDAGGWGSSDLAAMPEEEPLTASTTITKTKGTWDRLSDNQPWRMKV